MLRGCFLFLLLSGQRITYSMPHSSSNLSALFENLLAAQSNVTPEIMRCRRLLNYGEIDIPEKKITDEIDEAIEDFTISADQRFFILRLSETLSTPENPIVKPLAIAEKSNKDTLELKHAIAAELDGKRMEKIHIIGNRFLRLSFLGSASSTDLNNYQRTYRFVDLEQLNRKTDSLMFDPAILLGAKEIKHMRALNDYCYLISYIDQSNNLRFGMAHIDPFNMQAKFLSGFFQDAQLFKHFAYHPIESRDVYHFSDHITWIASPYISTDPNKKLYLKTNKNGFSIAQIKLPPGAKFIEGAQEGAYYELSNGMLRVFDPPGQDSQKIIEWNTPPRIRSWNKLRKVKGGYVAISDVINAGPGAYTDVRFFSEKEYSIDLVPDDFDLKKIRVFAEHAYLLGNPYEDISKLEIRQIVFKSL